jgi:hypothetical protein
MSMLLRLMRDEPQRYNVIQSEIRRQKHLEIWKFLS